MASPARKTGKSSTRPDLDVVPGETLAPRLDPLIHERVRLGIVSALATRDVLSFSELKESLGLTDGNLSIHARKLEDAGYVLCKKSFVGRKPRTEYRLSAAGRRALETYVDHMEAVLRATRTKPQENTRRPR